MTYRSLRLTTALAVTMALALALFIPASPAGAATAATAKCTLPAGTSSLPVELAGTTYQVRVHAPAGGVTAPAPLVLDLHGTDSTGSTQAAISGFDALSDTKGFIVANPSAGVPFGAGTFAWNVPGVPLTSGANPPAGSRDEVAFLSALITTLIDSGCAKSGSVAATGYSGGGRMASALACARADLISAVAPVGGVRAGRANPANVSVIEVGSCTPSTPVSVLAVHGTADYTNQYNGNMDRRWGYSVDTAIAAWAALGSCATPATTSTVTNTVTKRSYPGCAGGTDVSLLTVAGGGHTWPGTSARQDGVIDRSINASQLIWDFFAAHQRTPTPPKLQITATAGTRCVAGKVILTLTVINADTVPVHASIAVPSKDLGEIPAGQSTFHALTTRQASVPSGTLGVTVTSDASGQIITTQVPASYDARNCS
jgi:polyhydroxybutyrate depolymerase